MKTYSKISLPVHPANLAEWEEPHYKAYLWFYVTIAIVIFILFLIALKICYTTFCVPHHDCPCYKCDPKQVHPAWGEQNRQLISGAGNNLKPGSVSGITIDMELPSKVAVEKKEKTNVKEFKLTQHKRGSGKPLDLEIINEIAGAGDSGISSPGGKSSDSTSPSRLDIPEFHRRYSQPQIIPTGIHEVDGASTSAGKPAIGFEGLNSQTQV